MCTTRALGTQRSLSKFVDSVARRVEAKGGRVRGVGEIAVDAKLGITPDLLLKAVKELGAVWIVAERDSIWSIECLGRVSGLPPTV